ncbi:PREDICTED: putative leucine-rich repeat-containing protein DDB_G0290503 [Acromyrmex echinatior]|uniref:putative leucine-rich repeat-containing protein DDB_G0290503 n=1 Tax=Acromyrmex echinatior TaxID=103372 RepID=UPI000580F4D1|nr:PREDICTED: putative leucine-rich repeat-containing protein DDB_G0290503 [Acromyrmex echinatior]
MVAVTNEDKTLLQPFNDNLNAKDITINLKFPEKAKKCNTEKYICHCEEDCSSSSSKESSSKILSSSKDEPEKINHQRRLTKHKNAKANILQQQLPKLYHENPYELPFSNLINYFPIQSYPEKMNIPPVPILYGITPNILSQIVGNEGKYVDVGIPFISFQDRQNYLVENNQDQSVIHKKPCVCSPVITNSVESSMSVTNSPLTDYDDAITSRETINDLESNNPIGVTEEDQEHFPKLTTEISNVDASVDSETETNLMNYLTDATEEDDTISSSNLNKVMQKSNDFTEQTEKNLDDFSKSTTYSADDVDTSSVTYDITNDGKFINMEECIKLFGRDVCVLSAISPKIFAKQAQENPNKYSAIRIPEYVTQISPRDDINHSNKLKATDPHFASKSSTDKINKSNVNVNEYLESTSIKSNDDNDEASLHEFHPESKKQISKSDINYDKSTPLNTNQETNIKSNSNTSQKESTTVISYDSKLDPKKQDRNYLKESNANIYSKKKIPQEHFEEETITSSNPRTRDNFVEEIKKEIIGIETSIKPEEIPQEQSTTMQYFNDKKSSNSNNKENITNSIKTIDSSTNKLPFCDNSLLLNSIRKVINDFTSNTRLTKTKDFDENILQTQGKNLLPEILQVPNLKDILSMPQIENTIVDKVKDVLSYVTAIPRKDFTNDWSHGVIKNTLHSILNTLSGFRHKLPPMMLEEHQFKDGQWKTHLVTLAPILDQKLLKATPKNLREIIKELLNSPAIASQIDQNIMPKNSEDTDTLEQSNEIISDEADMDMINMQEISTNQILKKIDGQDDAEKKIAESLKPKIIYHKAILQNNLSVLEPNSTGAEQYIKNHPIDKESNEETITITNFIQETPNYVSDNKILENTVGAKDAEEEVNHTLTSMNFIQKPSSNYAQDDIPLQNTAETKDENEMEYLSTTDDNILEPQQQNLTENNIIKIHEVTTEIQRTYAKTTYFKAGLSGDDSSRTNSPSLTDKTTNIRINNDNENSNELQKSQLYYINDDGVKLPLEIKRLEDGSYALLISKNVCEQILTRKCPCCVPLQGHIVRSSKNHQQEDIHAMTINTEKKDQENVLGSNNFPFQSFNTVTRRNALRTQNLKKEEEEEKERNNEHHLWKLNDDNFAMISMPVIDFAKKYNLLLDFNEERVLLNKTELQNKILNYNKSIINSVEGFKRQSDEKNVNNYDNIKKNGLLDENGLLYENNEAIDEFSDLINSRKKKNTPNMNFPVSPKDKFRKSREPCS